MSENLVIPQDPSADDEARGELAHLGDLFGPDALSARMKLVTAAAERRSGIPMPADSVVAAKVSRSMRWATVTEVALRLMFDDLESELIEKLDALAMALRISRGLAERRITCDLALVGALVEVADELRNDLNLDQSLITQHRQTLEVFKSHAKGLTVWNAEEVALLVTSLPVGVISAAAAELAERNESNMWQSRISASFGACQYLALDLAVIIASEPSTDSEMISPARDCMRMVRSAGKLAGEQQVSDVVRVYVPLMDDYAIELQDQILAATNAGAPSIVIQYARSALIAAASAYQALAANGRIER